MRSKRIATRVSAGLLVGLLGGSGVAKQETPRDCIPIASREIFAGYYALQLTGKVAEPADPEAAKQVITDAGEAIITSRKRAPARAVLTYTGIFTGYGEVGQVDAAENDMSFSSPLFQGPENGIRELQNYSRAHYPGDLTELYFTVALSHSPPENVPQPTAMQGSVGVVITQSQTCG